MLKQNIIVKIRSFIREPIFRPQSAAVPTQISFKSQHFTWAVNKLAKARNQRNQNWHKMAKSTQKAKKALGIRAGKKPKSQKKVSEHV